MPTTGLREFLDSNKVKYISIQHSPAYTAQEIASVAHIPGKELAKSVIVNVDGKIAMAVLPASHRVDFKRLKEAIGAKEVKLAKEPEFEGTFPDCQLGAMPPFGNLYGVDVFADESLTEDEEFAFNACSHTELIRLAYRDFEELVKPQVMKLSR